MRYFIILSSLLAVTALFGRSAVPALKLGYKSSPRSSFQVRSTSPDAQLDQNHAVFELRFGSYQSNNGNFGSETFEFTAGSSVSSKVELSCNGVIETFALDSSNMKELTVMPGKYKFYIAFGEGYEEIVTDSIAIQPGHRMVVDVQFVPLSRPLPEVICFKPVIYLYPEKDLGVHVDLTPKGNFTFTYPQYDNGWSGTAHPDGSMMIAGKSYPYLFWEGTNAGTFSPDYTTGFVVQQEEVVAFLEEKLSAMGLNAREQADFITFWGPKMASVPQGHAQFLFNEEYDNVATLAVSPKPDAVFRVYLLWTPLEDDHQLHPRPQSIPKMEREGFHVLEWGGSTFPMNQPL